MVLMYTKNYHFKIIIQISKIMEFAATEATEKGNDLNCFPQTHFVANDSTTTMLVKFPKPSDTSLLITKTIKSITTENKKAISAHV